MSLASQDSAGQSGLRVTPGAPTCRTRRESSSLAENGLNVVVDPVVMTIRLRRLKDLVSWDVDWAKFPEVTSPPSDCVDPLAIGLTRLPRSLARNEIAMLVAAAALAKQASHAKEII
jgi:hypothetical protein